MKTIMLAVAVALASGCGGNPADPGGDPGPAGCQARHGLYRSHFVTKSGMCGAIPDAIVNIDDSTATADCVGAVIPPDVCDGAFDFRCPSQDKATVSHFVGRVHWAADGSSGSETVNIDIQTSDGTFLCTGIYDVTFARF